jgi:hypothetical protein
VALTDLAELMVTSQMGMRTPEQSPLQPTKRWRRSGVAVRMTTVSSPYASEQSGPQLMPEGMLVTVPAPVVDTVSVKVRKKVAVTVRAALIVTMQLPTPEQPAPLQPEKIVLAPGVAVRVTTVPMS